MAENTEASFLDDGPAAATATPEAGSEESNPSVIPDSTQGDGTTQFPKWMSNLPDALKQNENLAGYESIGSLAEAVLNSDGQKAELEIPADDDADGWEALYTKLGRPENKSDYTVSENIPETIAENVKDLAHQMGLSQKQLDTLTGTMGQTFDLDAAIREASYAGTKDETEQQLKKAWGDSYETERNFTIKGAEQLLPPSMRKVLGMLNQLNNPEIIKACNRFGHAIADDIPSGGGEQKSDVDQNNPWGYPDV